MKDEGPNSHWAANNKALELQPASEFDLEGTERFKHYLSTEDGEIEISFVCRVRGSRSVSSGSSVEKS
jgi:hypothetical protein